MRVDYFVFVFKSICPLHPRFTQSHSLISSTHPTANNLGAEDIGGDDGGADDTAEERDGDGLPTIAAIQSLLGDFLAEDLVKGAERTCRWLVLE